MKNEKYDCFKKMWFDLKKHVVTKNSHGKNELLQAMVDLEIKYNNAEDGDTLTIRDPDAGIHGMGNVFGR